MRRGLAGAQDLGVTASHQVTDIPAAQAEVVQHDRHSVRCSCGRVHTAATPDGAGAPGTTTYGLQVQALCVFLLVMHYVPVQRCADIIEAVSGVRPSDGFMHSLLARAARGAAAACKLIRSLIILAGVVCADETPIRVGPGPKTRKKYLLVACTRLLTHYFLGGRDLGSFRASVLSDLSGTVVHDRYVNYDAFPGLVHQLCCAHMLRDIQDAFERYPSAIWPGQIAGALCGLIHAANTARDQGLDTIPDGVVAEDVKLFRNGVAVGLAQIPRIPGSNEKQQPRPAAAGMPARSPRRCPALPHRPAHPSDQQRRRTRPAAIQDPAENLWPAPLPDRHPRPLRDPRLPVHRRQARRFRLRRHHRRSHRKPLDAAHPRQHVNHTLNPSHTATRKHANDTA